METGVEKCVAGEGSRWEVYQKKGFGDGLLRQYLPQDKGV